MSILLSTFSSFRSSSRPWAVQTLTCPTQTSTIAPRSRVLPSGVIIGVHHHAQGFFFSFFVELAPDTNLCIDSGTDA